MCWENEKRSFKIPYLGQDKSDVGSQCLASSCLHSACWAPGPLPGRRQGLGLPSGTQEIAALLVSWEAGVLLPAPGRLFSKLFWLPWTWPALSPWQLGRKLAQASGPCGEPWTSATTALPTCFGLCQWHLTVHVWKADVAEMEFLRILILRSIFIECGGFSSPGGHGGACDRSAPAAENPWGGAGLTLGTH